MGFLDKDELLKEIILTLSKADKNMDKEKLVQLLTEYLKITEQNGEVVIKDNEIKIIKKEN